MSGGILRRTASGEAFHLPGGHYLLSHSVGCLPAGTRELVEENLFAPWAEAGSNAWTAWLGVIDRFRSGLAGLLGGDPAFWCPQPSVSAGVSKLLGALPSSPRRTLLLSRHAFPSIGYAATGFEALGFQVCFLDGDPTDLSPWDAAMDENVAAIIVMHVHSNSGLVSPVEELTAMARSRGIFSIVDVCQSAGIVPVDVTRFGADAVVGSCVKWLCGGPGAGFLWVDPAQVERLEPVERGWFSHEAPFEFNIEDFRYAPDARRFWSGTPAIAPYSAAIGGIEAIARIGISAIRAHNRSCLNALVAEVSAQWQERMDMAGRGGTLCLAAGAEADRLQRALAKAGCLVDRRDDVLRISFHIYNDMGDVAAVAEALRSIA